MRYRGCLPNGRGLWNPTSRKVRETWGNRSLAGVGMLRLRGIVFGRSHFALHDGGIGTIGRCSIGPSSGVLRFADDSAPQDDKSSLVRGFWFVLSPHALSQNKFKRLREFQGYEFGGLVAGVGDGVGVVAGEPFGVAGFEVSGHGALALDVAAEVEIADGD